MKMRFVMVGALMLVVGPILCKTWNLSFRLYREGKIDIPDKMFANFITFAKGVARDCRACHSFATILLACCVLAFATGLPTVAAQAPQDSKQPASTQSTATPASPAAAEPAPQNSTPANACASPAPSSGKALVCVYRQSRAVGAAAHDNLFVNGIFLAKLLNGEYASMEVQPGTVVVTGLPRMYYGPSVIMSSAAAANQTRKENERIRFDAEAGKTYYFKWTSGMFASGITVTPMDVKTGAKELGKLHPSKNTDSKEVAKDEGKEGGK